MYVCENAIQIKLTSNLIEIFVSKILTSKNMFVILLSFIWHPFY